MRSYTDIEFDHYNRQHMRAREYGLGYVINSGLRSRGKKYHHHCRRLAKRKWPGLVPLLDTYPSIVVHPWRVKKCREWEEAYFTIQFLDPAEHLAWQMSRS